MKPTAEQTKELSNMMARLRADIPNVVNEMVPPEHRIVTLRVMLAMVPPMYAAMVMEHMAGTPPDKAQASAMYALAVGISGIISMTTSPEKTAEVAASMTEGLGEMLQRWATVEDWTPKPH